MDTLQANASVGAGIPDPGMRVIALVAVLFVLSIMGAVLYTQMKHVDGKSGG